MDLITQINYAAMIGDVKWIKELQQSNDPRIGRELHQYIEDVLNILEK